MLIAAIARPDASTATVRLLTHTFSPKRQKPPIRTGDHVMLSTKPLRCALAALALILVGINAANSADRPYTEGPVLIVSSIRTEPGMFEEYMKYLAGPYKQLMEGYKKAGIIVDYLSTRRRHSHRTTPISTSSRSTRTWPRWTGSTSARMQSPSRLRVT